MKLSSAPCLLLVAVLFCGCKCIVPTHSQFSRFAGFDNFATFACTTNSDGECVLLSPVIPAHIAWNQSIVSWNVDAPPGTYVKVEACAIADGKPSKFYTMAEWSLDGKIFPRTSVKGQADDDGTIDADTMILKHNADAAQLRVTLGGANNVRARLKFVGIDFANTKVAVAIREPNRKAWGKIITTPEHSQHGYPNEKGWCSPTSTSMVLSRWAGIMHRPEMDLTVPQVATSVYDTSFEGTGNWPFNTAFAGSFDGMRAYVTRLDDLREVEDWIVAGLPVILSARWDWLQDGRPADADGHLIVCIGFTKDGDVVINDPATRLDRGESVRHIYKRANVIHSWTKSHGVVYLVYPEGTKIPRNRYGHWQ